jgi:hypothetical protein
MANPSYTHSLTNGTTADASQVMQNFNDILNGVTDGTKDLSINALTAAGTVNLNGNTTLGNSSADDLTVSASLASSIPVKTTASFDVGSSTLGLQSIYFGRNSQTVRIIGSSSMSATWTLTLPVDDGTTDQWFVTNGSGTASWTNTVTTGKTIDGSADEIQLKVQGHSSQSANILEVEDSSANDLFAVNSIGTVTAGLGSGTGSRPQHTFNARGNSGSGLIVLDAITALSDTHTCEFRAYDAGSAKFRTGIYKRSTNAVTGFLGCAAEDTTVYFLWPNAGTWYTGSTITNIGSSTGTVVGTQTSDARLKSNIEDYEGGLDVVSQLRPRRYELNGKVELGFVAQETVDAIPESVYRTEEGEDGLYAMSYVRIMPALVNAIKELKTQVEALQAS